MINFIYIYIYCLGGGGPGPASAPPSPPATARPPGPPGTYAIRCYVIGALHHIILYRIISYHSMYSGIILYYPPATARPPGPPEVVTDCLTLNSREILYEGTSLVKEIP